MLKGSPGFADSLSTVAKGNDLIALCNGCFFTVKEASHIPSENGKPPKPAPERTGKEPPGSANVIHFASLVTSLDKKELEPCVKAACWEAKNAVQHGCHILRPAEQLSFDDPFNPTRLESFSESIGAEPVCYRGYTDCCGRAVFDRKKSLEMASAKLGCMKDAVADCVLVLCPVCFGQLDSGQIEIRRRMKEEHGLPVLHLAQLAAQALSTNARELGFGFTTFWWKASSLAISQDDYEEAY